LNHSPMHRTVSLALLSAFAIGAAGVSTGSRAAGTATANLGVDASVLGTCTIATTPVSFGNYEATAASALPGTGSVTLTCADGTAANVTLGEGVNPFSAAPATPLRQMAMGANRLAYFLYQDAARATVWGNTVATGVPQVGVGAAGVPLVVYGAVTAGQNAPIGNYSDIVVATVTF
jgi:spore coat protein U-like protein